MINYTVDSDGVATLTWDTPGPVNTLSSASRAAFEDALGRALGDGAVRGIILASAKDDFIAGADLKEILATRDLETLEAYSRGASATIRRLETGGKPVVAAINGTALGGGLEFALGCHYRIAADNPKARIGLPEVTLGLLPGAGGTQRLPRLIGLKAALPLLLEGKRLKVAEAHALGIVHEVVPATELLARAKAWLLGAPKAEQPWDRRGFRMPGGDLNHPDVQGFYSVAVAMVHQRAGHNYPAPRHILSAVYEGGSTAIDVGLRIESRHFGLTASTVQAANLIRTGFFALNDARKVRGRPADVPPFSPRRLGVLGAGLMGHGIAYVAARAGLEVVLLDRDDAAAQAGKKRCAELLEREVARGRLDTAGRDAVLARIRPTANYADLDEADAVIEAVFEDRAVKAEATAQAARAVGADTLFASNTSTLPITSLAATHPRPERFVGLHFFSPVHRMELVEVITGERTARETLAQALDLVKAIAKVPVVVRDARGFFTSRVFETYVREGLVLLEEGVAPALIENAGRFAGMPLGPLELADEVALDLLVRIYRATEKDLGADFRPQPGIGVALRWVEELGRPGKKAGKGFYDYAPDGKRLSAELMRLYPPHREQPTLEDVQRRLLDIQSIETLRCLEEGVVRSARDADVASLLGWGYPPWAGGVASYVDTVGAQALLARAQALAQAGAQRFEPPPGLRTLAQRGGSIHEASA
jgi:3-hydroxyacyl-CoA dehydrogenase / enoyl-CoA hydratase / 3-hydroxybutyryl-CoA epimerase